jgi:hypothetical protein
MMHDLIVDCPRANREQSTSFGDQKQGTLTMAYAAIRGFLDKQNIVRQTTN